MTALDYLDLSMRVLGALYVLATLVSMFAPAAWRITLWCAKHASDLRDLRLDIGSLKQ
jgi:hypothetical protein